MRHRRKRAIVQLSSLGIGVRLCTSLFSKQLVWAIGLTLICTETILSQHNMHVPPGDVQLLIEELERQVQSGNRRALRDLATLLDQEPYHQRICHIIREYTLFLPQEISDVDICDRKQMLNFFYEHQEVLRFSPLLMAFYLTPLEHRQVNARLELIPDSLLDAAKFQFAQQGQKIRQTLSEGDQQGFEKWIRYIVQSNLPAGYRLLIQLLNEQAIERSALPNKRNALSLAADAISHWSHEQSLDALLRLAHRQQLPSYLILPALEQLTNISLAHLPNLSLTARHYASMYDTLGSLSAMRETGYQQLFDFRKEHFQDDVDYYGRILGLASRFPYVRFNAIQDLVRTHHPRALFYIAAQLFKYRQQLNALYEGANWIQLLEKLTHVRVYVEGSDGTWRIYHEWSKDRKALVRYVSWWATHYHEFEWDELRGFFVHKKLALAQKENYEQFLRRLNSRNDSVALHAWVQLSEGDPIEVIALLNKYKGLFRQVNPAVPPIQEGYLEQWVQLIDFCRKHKLRWKPDSSLQNALQQLHSIEDPRQRYHFENQLINQLDAYDATALEYWCSLHPRAKALNLSIGRILDRLYARHWSTIESDQLLLRLYLKKAMAFKELKAMGLCQSYLEKCHLAMPDLEPRLRELLSVEYDSMIKRAIGLLLHDAPVTAHDSLEAFFAHPDAFSQKAIKKLPEPDGIGVQSIMRLLYTTYEPHILKKLFYYMITHPRYEWVPLVLQAMQRGTFEKEGQQVLAAIYHYRMPNGTEGWLDWWATHDDNYEAWGALLYERLCQIIRTTPQLDIQWLAQMIHSPWYRPSDKTLWLEALPKVNQLQLRRLRPQPRLELETDLKWFTSLPWTHRTLDDLPALFDLSGPVNRLIDFLLTASRSFSLSDRATFFNNLFRQRWFADYTIADRLATAHADTIRQVLRNWLAHTPFITEFEETTTMRNLALLDLLDMPLMQKIERSIHLPLNTSVLAKLQEELLARVQYEDLPSLVPLFDSLVALRHYNLLNKDFGLPIFQLHDHMVQSQLLHRLQTMPRKAVYLAYLNDFGVDIFTPQGLLDFQKIYEVLQFEIVLPFADRGGTFRDYFTYGVIKVLELHFRTRLGFHEKLNENQTFYVHTPFNRARAWQKFLVERNLAQPYRGTQHSFSGMAKE